MILSKIGLALLWGLRWGLFLLWPPLLWLTIVLLGSPLEPETQVVIPCLLVIAFYIGLRCNLTFPMQQQSDSPLLRRYASGVFAALCFCIAVILGSFWLYDTTVTQSNFVGETLYFVDEGVLSGFCLLAALLSLVLFILLLISLVLSFRQLRLLGWFATLSFGLFLLLLTVVIEKDVMQWRIKQTLIGLDGANYSFLEENPHGSFLDKYSKTQYSTALARHTGDGYILRQTEIILLNKQTEHSHPYAVLTNGKKHHDAAVRQACDMLLKAEQTASINPE